MRLFTAIDLPDGFRNEVAGLQAPSALDARWTDPAQFHVTLRFIGDALEREGLSPDDRDYTPHVTLARVGDTAPETVHAFLRTADVPSFPAFQADRFVLYESTLTSDGAVYDPQAIYPLNG
ncbi:2'-5' RNA ligase [Salinibacter ruber]|uniref:2'-5' RNA ligase family protein n=1 Tax=Salinibacter ruber TaxID=146919 RepID=UPI0021695DB9|nr:2'-5' RNA ligase family protein [Salinibacter ruber]MCS3938184.1 2'-5' RNA ligase [Salinibacter ruber]